MTRRYVVLYFLEDGMNVLLNFSLSFAFDLWNCFCFGYRMASSYQIEPVCLYGAKPKLALSLWAPL